MAALTSIDSYIQSFPKDIQTILNKLRKEIHAAAPKATEAMGYGVPAFKLNGYLVYFAAFKKHIGFYPTPSGIKAFSKELKSYEVSQGTVKFPLGKPIPYALIKKIVRYRVKEQLKK